MSYKTKLKLTINPIVVSVGPASPRHRVHTDKNNNEIGKVTSGTFGPSVKGPIAMGYVNNGHAKINNKVFLEVRGKKVPANICDLPFYKKNYVKGEANV